MAEEMNEKDENVDTLDLGGVIKLSGFRSLDRSTMVVVKKMVGSYARKFSDLFDGFERVAVDLKIVHENEESKKGRYELNAKAIISGKPFIAEEESHNLFIGLDSVFKKLEKQLMKLKE